MPNLFIIGAAKCGTTAMSHWLAAQPDIYMSEQSGVKEPKYFASDMRVPKARHTTRASYCSLFEPAAASASYLGEASALYLYSKVAVPTILEASPAAKLLVMLRNPVDMARSLHNQRVKQAQEPEFDFERAWRLQAERRRGRKIPFGVSVPDAMQYGDRACLGKQMQRLLQYVPRDQLHVIVHDDLRDDPSGVFEAVLEFLDLDYHEAEYGVSNPSMRVRWRVIQQGLSLARGVCKWLHIPGGWGLGKRILRVNTKVVAKEPLRPAFRRELQEYFRDDVMLLSELIDRDLSHWVSANASP